MASQDPPLDEVQWKAPDKVMELRGIHENSILYYFAYSPFFDQTSNNAVVFSQAMRNQSMLPLIETRAAFEGYLKTMSGLEYVVAQEPAEMAPGTGTGVWVIRKQTRRKRQGQEDEITIHATYFVVGENIYMAPTLCDILSGRMLQITSSLNKIMSKAASLTEFTPSLGNTYLPPATNRSKVTESQPSQASQNSQANTPLPDSVPNSKKVPTLQTSTSSNLSTRLLEESLSISLKYGDEYMDENPITGFPGDFHLSTTGRKEKDKLMVPQAGKNTVLPPTKITIPPPMINSKTDSPTGRKGSKADKSPKTPGMPKPKRRKSKALMSGGTSPV